MVRHVVLPGVELRQARCCRRDTIARFVARERWPLTRLPTICVVNGRPLLRPLWRRRRIGSDDVVTFISRPYGPPGSNQGLAVAGLVGMIALAAFAPYLAGLALGAGTVGASLLASGAAMGGSLLIDASAAPGVRR